MKIKKISLSFSIFGIVLGMLSIINGLLNDQNDSIIIGITLSISYFLLGLFSLASMNTSNKFLKISLGIYLFCVLFSLIPIEYDGIIHSSFEYSLFMLCTGLVSNIILIIKNKI